MYDSIITDENIDIKFNYSIMLFLIVCCVFYSVNYHSGYIFNERVQTPHK